MSNVGVHPGGEQNPCPESGKASEAESEAFEGFDGVIATLSKSVGQANVECVQDVRPPVGEHFLNWLEPQLSIKLEGIMRASFEEFVMEEYGQYPDDYLENYDEYFKLDDLYGAHK